MNTSLIDRYVKEVGRRLPRKTRGDVETELRSLLSDALRDRTAGREPMGPEALEAEQIAVLRAFGSPATVAARYAPPRRYLIGPNAYDLYTVVLFSVGIAITAAVILLAGLSMIGGETLPGGFFPHLGDFLGLLFQWLLTAFGSITLVFAIVGRLLPEEAALEEKEEAWDPRALPEIDDWTRVNARGILFETVCIIAALAVFNLFPDWVRLYFPASVNDAPARWISIPLLSDAFYGYFLPVWNIILLLSVLLNLFLLRRGRWERLTRAAEFGLALFGIVLLGAMLAGPSLIDVRGVYSESTGSLLQSTLSGLLAAILAVSLIAAIIDAARKGIAIFRPRPASLPPLTILPPASGAGRGEPRG
jgi:hypothetical protein